MRPEIEFEAEISTLDELISVVRALPSFVKDFRLSSDMVRGLIAEADKKESFFIAEIAEKGRRVRFENGTAHFERSPS